MTKREQLQEQFEDALFALLIEDAKQAHNEQAAALHEQLKQSNEIQISPEFNERMQAFIRQNCSRKRRPIRVNFPKLVSRVAVAACFTILITSTAFATFPDLKTNLMNLYLEVAEGHMDFHFGEDDITNTPETESYSDIPTEDNFTVSWLPDGFYESEKNYMEDFIVEYKYLSDSLPEDEAFISIKKIFGDGTTTSIDTEDSEVRNVTVGSADAVFTRKMGSMIFR